MVASRIFPMIFLTTKLFDAMAGDATANAIFYCDRIFCCIYDIFILLQVGVLSFSCCHSLLRQTVLSYAAIFTVNLQTN